MPKIRSSRRAPVVAAAALAAAGAAASASAQVTVLEMFREFDAIGSSGTARDPQPGDVNNSGAWIAGTTLSAGTDTSIPDYAFVGDFDLALDPRYAVLAAELDPVAADPTRQFSNIDDDGYAVNNAGNFATYTWFEGTGSNTAIMWRNERIIVRRDSVTSAVALQPGTLFAGFFGIDLNDSNQILVVANMRRGGAGGPLELAMMRLDYNPATQTHTETALVKVGDTLPGTFGPGVIEDFETDGGTWAMNNAGSIAYRADISGDDTTAAGVYRDTALVAGVFADSPVSGRLYATFGSVDLNNGGDVAFRGTITGASASDGVIVKKPASGAAVLIAQEGQTIGGQPILEIGAPVAIDDAGNVFWWGAWSTTPRRGALFRNTTPILVDDPDRTLVTGADAFSVSNNGRFVLATATVGGGSPTQEAKLLLDLGGPACVADFNASGTVDVADIFSFLSAWFSQTPAANVNGDGAINVADIFVFLSLWFARC